MMKCFLFSGFTSEDNDYINQHQSATVGDLTKNSVLWFVLWLLDNETHIFNTCIYRMTLANRPQ